MYLEFLGSGKVSLFVDYYIEESIALFGKDLDATESSPENKGLQDIN